MTLNLLRIALKKGNLTHKKIKSLFFALDEDGWEQLEIYFDEEDRDYITELFCRELGVKDVTD